MQQRAHAGAPVIDQASQQKCLCALHLAIHLGMPAAKERHHLAGAGQQLNLLLLVAVVPTGTSRPTTVKLMLSSAWVSGATWQVLAKQLAKP